MPNCDRRHNNGDRRDCYPSVYDWRTTETQFNLGRPIKANAGFITRNGNAKRGIPSGQSSIIDKKYNPECFGSGVPVSYLLPRCVAYAKGVAQTSTNAGKQSN